MRVCLMFLKYPTQAVRIVYTPYIRNGVAMQHNYFYQLEHKRLRETYSWDAILRHEQWIMRALRVRYYQMLGEAIPESSE